MPIFNQNKSNIAGGLNLRGGHAQPTVSPRTITPKITDIRSKAQVGKGKIDLEKLRQMKDKRTSKWEVYKLNQNGQSRFRLVMPLGSDELPIALADTHYLPYVDDTGKSYGRTFYCLQNFDRRCPICQLSDMLLRSEDAGLAEEKQLVPAARWGMLVVNRDYMIANGGIHDPDLDKIMLFIAPKTIGDGIIQLFETAFWGDPTDPDDGYDIHVVGTKKTGSAWPEYSMQPVPRDQSPAYSIALTKGIKPLSHQVVPPDPDELSKILTPILMAIAGVSEDGQALVFDYKEVWKEYIGAPDEESPAERRSRNDTVEAPISSVRDEIEGIDDDDGGEEDSGEQGEGTSAEEETDFEESGGDSGEEVRESGDDDGEDEVEDEPAPAPQKNKIKSSPIKSAPAKPAPAVATRSAPTVGTGIKAKPVAVSGPSNSLREQLAGIGKKK